MSLSEPLFDSETGEIHQAPEGCPDCATSLRDRVQAEGDLQAAERELRKSRREVNRLKGELQRQRTEGPLGYQAKALFRYWVARCEKNSKRTVFGEKRLEKVTARLREHDVQYVARAIDGLAIGAYVSDQGAKYDDLELVCRDEVHLERFHDLAERRDAPTLMGPAWLKEFEGVDLVPEEPDAAPF